MNSGERLILRFLLAGSDVDWNSLLTVSATVVPSEQRPDQPFPAFALSVNRNKLVLECNAYHSRVTAAHSATGTDAASATSSAH